MSPAVERSAAKAQGAGSSHPKKKHSSDKKKTGMVTKRVSRLDFDDGIDAMEIDAAMEARFKMYDKKIAQWLAICAGWQPESVETSSDLPDKVIKAVQLLILYIAPPDSAEHTATGGAVEPSSCKPLRPILTIYFSVEKVLPDLSHIIAVGSAPELRREPSQRRLGGRWSHCWLVVDEAE